MLLVGVQNQVLLVDLKVSVKPQLTTNRAPRLTFPKRRMSLLSIQSIGRKNGI